MNVLVVDDDPVTRTLLRRVLVRQFACTVVEAVDGLAALAALGRQPFDFVVTDLRMPSVTGLELLEAIRGFPRLARLPVVIMSVERTEGKVRAAIQLGVDGFFVKPLDANVVSAKLAELVQATATTVVPPPTAETAALEARGAFLIADGNPDFRHLFASTFSSSRPVLQVATGVDALSQAGISAPEVIFIGAGLGLLDGDLLIRKLRGHPSLGRTKLVALRSRHAREPMAGIDHVIVRSLVPEAFRRQVAALFGPLSPAGGVLIGRSTLRTQLASACEQVFALTLGLDVEPSLTEAPGVPAGALAATQFIDWAEGHERLRFTLYLDDASAVRVAAAMSSTAATAVSPELAESVAGEVCHAITRRLEAWYAAAGTTVQCSVPATGRTDKPWLPPGDPHTVFSGCLTADRDLVCVATLTPVAPPPEGPPIDAETPRQLPVGAEA